jgi:thiosulfate/3-mercaptopyruvate sulfurtransferase
VAIPLATVNPNPMKIFFTLLSCFSMGQLFAEVPILVTPKWVNEHRSDPNVRVLHVSFLKFDYNNEHIAGAGYLWPGWLAPDSPEGAMNIPDLKKAEEIIGGLGISNKTHVVLYFIRNEVSPTTRMFLTLENLGLVGQVSLMDGGIEAWKKEGLPVSKEVPMFKKATFKAKNLGLLVDKNYVIKNLKSEAVTIVDARATRFYDGDPTGNPRDGHIAGAKNIPYMDMVDQANIFKPTDQLQNYFNSVVPDKKTEIVAYCFIGQTASVVYFTARLLGYPVKLYDGSMQEWSRLPELPMELTEKKKEN